MNTICKALSCGVFAGLLTVASLPTSANANAGKWILISIINGVLTTQEFESEETCESALTWVANSIATKEEEFPLSIKCLKK